MTTGDGALARPRRWRAVPGPGANGGDHAAAAAVGAVAADRARGLAGDAGHGRLCPERGRSSQGGTGRTDSRLLTKPL